VVAPKGSYRVFYADPPWSYGNSGLQQYGHASHHYPTMTIDELCALPIEKIAQKDAALFLWVTSPLLMESAPVIEAWGFTYKTSIVWSKDAHVFGHYVSVRHEFLLLCTRGSCTPDIRELLPSIVTVKRSKTHSEKPEEFRRMIDTMYPKGARIELFSRSKHKDWDSWGNEVPDV
jgi:N6-adenosine-specific RNA methylase IME4